MCLVTRQIKPITTKEDLVVFKYVRINEDKSVWSCYYPDEPWKKGELKTTELYSERRLPKGVITFDYETDFVYKDAAFVKQDEFITSISKGFHAALTKKRLKNLHCRKFLIPKGSKVFKDSTGLIVSNKMMLL